MESLAGKTCLVTAGTSGIGGAISDGLARLGAHVIMVGRDPEKGARVVAELTAATGNANVEFLPADLLSQRGIRRLADMVTQTQPRLDVLVNNVGGAFRRRAVTDDGVERSLALNLVAPFLVTELLLPLLERSRPARIINVATKPRKGDTVRLDDLQSQQSYDAFGAYGRAKTGLIMWTYELARRLEGTGVTANCLHPGVVPETDFTRDLPKAMQVIAPLFLRLTGVRVTLAEAADTALHLASSPEVATVSGKYFHKRQPVESLPQTYDQETARRLWDALSGLVAASAR